MKPYRSCIVAVIRDGEGRVFAGERRDRPGIWQLPQGGVDDGEDYQAALFRELKEEIGTDQLRVLECMPDPLAYDFPKDLQAPIAERYRGQEQRWFLLEFKDSAKPSIEDSDMEFQDLAWKKPDELLADIVYWKKPVYQAGLRYFNLL